MSAAVHSGVVDAAISCASALAGMEVTLVVGVRGDRARYDRVRGAYPGVEEGYEGSFADTLCARMVEGAPPATADAANDPIYSQAPDRARLGLTSYVGVPVRNALGEIVATLCCLDRGSVPVTEATVGVLRELASIIATQLPADAPDVVIRRTASGWLVGERDAPCLTSAMVLADLLAADLAPPPRPVKPATELGEVDRLRLAIVQLEHALAARVLVEQALGVLSERLGTSPRDAFELLRKIARRGGIRVHELSRDIMASVGDPAVPLPAELARR